MSEELLQNFAKSLIERREELGFNLQQIAGKTKIDIKFLKAMEDGNFEIMSEVYVRAFIRDYAEVVDLDITETLKKYDEAKIGKSYENDEVIPDENHLPSSKLNNPKTKFISPEVNELPISKINESNSTNVIAIFVGVILVILLSVYFIFLKPSSDQIIKEKPFDQVLNETKRYELESDSNKTVQTISEQQTSGLSNIVLKLLATDTVWVRLRIDNETDKEFTLKPGEKQTVSANNIINILVGNLGGIKFNINNNDYDLNGFKGQVQNLQVDKHGITKIKVAQVKVNE